jgi:predicted deacylase
VLHNAFLDVGIPAFTPEIGAARVLNLEMIKLFVEGTINVLKHHGIVAGPMGRTGKDVRVFVGDSAFPIRDDGVAGVLVTLDRDLQAAARLSLLTTPAPAPALRLFVFRLCTNSRWDEEADYYGEIASQAGVTP